MNEIEMEVEENMFIEQNSTVMGQYMNDYVIYIDEPYYVYVSVEDLQEVDANTVDGYQWDTGDENSKKDKAPEDLQSTEQSQAGSIQGGSAATSAVGARSATTTK